MFSEQDRQIFGPYFNGQQMVYADPLAVRRKLVHELGGDPDRFLRDSNQSEDAVRFPARETLLAAALTALQMIPFDPSTGQGSLEVDVWSALNTFLDFIEKKNGSPLNSPTSVPTTEVPESLVPDLSPAEMVTPSTLVSYLPFQGSGCNVPGR